jgi:NAD+ kinase
VHEPPDRAIRSRQHGMPYSQFSWHQAPRNALIIKKPNDSQTTAVLPMVVSLLKEKGITAWVEPAVHWETALGAGASTRPLFSST